LDRYQQFLCHVFGAWLPLWSGKFCHPGGKALPLLKER